MRAWCIEIIEGTAMITPVKISAILLLATGLAACARTPSPQALGATVEVAPTPEPEGLPSDWKQVATTTDLDRIGRIEMAWGEGLTEARARRHTREIDKEGPLLDPAGALPRPAVPPGTYRCRVIKLGFGSSGRGRAFQTFNPFTCFVSVEDSLLVFIKATGSELPAGRLWDDGETRLVFLGATAAKPGVPAPAYGTQPARDRSGVIERIGDFRWRLVSPWQSKDARIEVMELVPDTPAAPAPAATGG
jgi:hypothetical protein